MKFISFIFFSILLFSCKRKEKVINHENNESFANSKQISQNLRQNSLSNKVLIITTEINSINFKTRTNSDCNVKYVLFLDNNNFLFYDYCKDKNEYVIGHYDMDYLSIYLHFEKKFELDIDEEKNNRLITKGKSNLPTMVLTPFQFDNSVFYKTNFQNLGFANFNLNLSATDEKQKLQSKGVCFWICGN